MNGKAPGNFRASQRGISLLVVLILLLVSTMLGLAVLRSSSMQERMSANLRDRSLAYQATEAALVFAADQIVATDGAANPEDDLSKFEPTVADCDPTCNVNGIRVHPQPLPGAVDRWVDGAVAWQQVPNSAYDEERLASAPEYIIEYMGKVPSQPDACLSDPKPIDCENPMYRITARTQSLGRAQVMLQTNVIHKIDMN